jgi:hypothetical protein
MRAYWSVGRLLGVAVAAWALGCSKSDVTTGQGGTGGQGGTTGVGGSTSTGGTNTATGGVGGLGGLTGTGGMAGAAGHPVTAVPPLHRPTAVVCSDAGAPLSGYEGGTRLPTADGGTIGCTTASTCPACSNGLPDRCVALNVLTNGGGGGASGSSSICASDECISDQDCGPKGVCSCGTQGGNICLFGNCRVDSDCGPGGYCSPSTPRSCSGGSRGYYCHTAQDQCRADADCQGLACTYSIEAAIWTCATIYCAG